MQKKHDTCTMKNCGQASDGKQYCPQHASLGSRRKLSGDMMAHIRSACCTVKCVSGKAHENGEQYCTKCKEPCCWKTVC